MRTPHETGKEVSAPKVFISHASEDKERFVLPFAEKLRAKGIDAWVDTWEMLPGDSLVTKIFEEGIKQASAVIVVLSSASVSKPWVKEELDASVVKRINHGSQLIPVVIDDCEVPMALQATVWSRIKDLSSYDAEFSRIVDAIFKRRPRPPLGLAPKYVSVSVDTLPNLNHTDTVIFLKACEIALGQRSSMIDTNKVTTALADSGIADSQLNESLQILDSRGFIQAERGMRGRIPVFKLTHYGFDQYLRSLYPEYEKLYDRICLAILNDGIHNNHELVKRLGEPPIAVINHVLDDLERRSLLRVSVSTSGHNVYNISPELRRAFENRV